MRVLLIPVLLYVTQISSSPADPLWSRRERRDTVIVEDDPVTTTITPPTFQVERLDTPMERIEIRLIDEHDEHENGTTAARATEGTEAAAGEEVSIRSNHSSGITVNVVEDIPTAPTEAAREYNDKYKKVEYVSDAHITVVEDTTTAEPTAAVETTSDVTEVDEGLQNSTPRGELQAKAWLSFSSRMPKTDIFDGDIGQLPPEIDAQNSPDDEPESVEECLANKDELPFEVVEKLRAQTQTLARMIKKVNKQQKQYCAPTEQSTAQGEVATASEYRQCPIWREEKMVHYYKLMRITYCADYNRWPNASRVKRAYAQYLPLFETLYAFQKSENA